MERKSREMNLYPVGKPAPGSMEMLKAYHWPGNVRELENIVERALIRSSTHSRGEYLRFDEPHLSPVPPQKTTPEKTLPPNVLNMNDAVKQHIESVLKLTRGIIAGEDGAAELLGLPTSTLRNRMKKLGMLP